MNRRVLAVATVAKSLVYQMPTAWEVLTTRGFQVTFAAAPDGYERRLNRWGSFIPLSMERNFSLSTVTKAVPQVRRILAGKWDLIQVQTPIAATIVRLLPRRETPLVYVAHGLHFHADGDPRANLLFKAVERLLSIRTDALVVVSDEDYEAVRSWPVPTIWHLPGAGVDLSRFAGRQRLAGEPHRLLYIGELNRNKDPMVAIDTARHLQSMGLEVELHVVGDGPMRNEVIRSSKNHLGQNVNWTSSTDDVPTLMTKASVLLHPSHREGLPRVLIEALANGLPVVSRENRGSRELLQEGHGQIVPRDASSCQFADAVIRLSQQPPSAKAMAEQMSRYSQEAFRQSYEELLQTLGGLETT